MKNAASFLKIKPITATESREIQQTFFGKGVIQSIALTTKAFTILTLPSFIKFPSVKLIYKLTVTILVPS